MDHVPGVLPVTAGAMLVGWVAERAFDTGLRVRGIGLLCGVIGLHVGSLLWSWAGLQTGPTIVGFPIVPAVAGSLAVCALLKLVTLGVAGPRW
jgi:uncharacterized membrane protein YeaQ/YmgE (transglycosylase-associated protein family)